MLTRAIRLVSLPMLALLLAVPAVAHAAPDTDSTNCSHDESKGPSAKPTSPPFTSESSDADSPSQFTATRSLSRSQSAPTHVTAHIAVCRASLTVKPSPDADAHLSISIDKPLSSRQLVSTFIRRFALVDSRLELEIDAPDGSAPRVSLMLPLGTTTELALVRGDLEFGHLLGDSQIAIVKGNAILHLADSDFRSLECATIMGGIHDRRPGGATYGHVLSTWTARGTGTAKIEFSAVSGDLILLPPTS